ncbi:unnamed protein product [Didymodactylos carnosus]|nr:unnamed protein product [Didymodactylos carnosus]CAF4461196.1 unnamed protein product [Didymodactylos carnosus]
MGKHQLKEHDYASKYPLFNPPEHEFEQHHITYNTSIQTLNQLIHIAIHTQLYTLDTESVLRRYQHNEPALIQIQLIRPHHLSTILLVEVQHLPPIHSEEFGKIQDLFSAILVGKNTIYVWGELSELDSFVKFGLFSHQQLLLPEAINQQNEFKLFWQSAHPHQPSASADCRCEQCLLDKLDGETWSLQDAMAHTLEVWLDKRLTIAPFDIGLDLSLQHNNNSQQEFRYQMIRYVRNDCLAMEKLMEFMESNSQQQTKFTCVIPPVFPESTSSCIEQTPTVLVEDEVIISVDEDINLNVPSVSSLEKTIRPSIDSQPSLVFTAVENPPKSTMTAEAKRSKNRRKTLKCRRKQFLSQLARHDIYHGFTVEKVRDVLDRADIKYTKIFKTPLVPAPNRQHHVFIGLQEGQDREELERRTKNWFTESHFNRLYFPHRRTPSPSLHRDQGRSKRSDHYSPLHSQQRRTSTPPHHHRTRAPPPNPQHYKYHQRRR